MCSIRGAACSCVLTLIAHESSPRSLGGLSRHDFLLPPSAFFTHFIVFFFPPLSDFGGSGVGLIEGSRLWMGDEPRRSSTRGT